MARTAALALALVLVPLAGCVEDPAPAASLDLAPAADPSVDVPRDDLSAFRETNRTESGIGGMAHDHDYWKGRDRVDLLSRRVGISPFPLLGRDDAVGSQSGDRAPDYPGLVYEGTATVEVVVKEPLLRAGAAPVPHAAPPPLKLLYLTAADGATMWRDGGVLAYGTPTVIPVRPEEVDMPHSLASLWLFRLEAAGSHSFSVNLTVTIVHGDDVPMWPGHPDFYGESRQRLVMDADGSTREPGLGESLVRDAFYDYVHPDRLISWGTTKLDVFVNVTRVSGPGGAPADPLSLYLRVRNATSQADDVYGFDDLESGAKRSFRFEVPVDANGMDSPYAPSSRWGFAMGAFYMAFSDSAPYELDYHLTVIAHGEPDVKPTEAVEG